jgi:Zn-dependent protease
MDLASFLTVFSVAAIPLVFAITLHEVAHGLVARHYGDRTAESLGRLSLNPLRHVDPVGTVLLPLLQLVFFKQVLFGWAKPVPVNPRWLNNPRGDMVKVALAGPAANIVMATFWAGVLALVAGLSGAGGPSGTSLEWLAQMGFYGVTINVLLAAFNLLPVPPLDGGRVLANGLPVGPVTRLLDRMEPWGLLIVVLLLVTNIAWTVLEPLMNLIESAIFALVGLH